MDTPKIIELKPTSFIAFLESPAPMKNNVKVKPCFATDTIFCVSSNGILANVFISIAMIK